MDCMQEEVITTMTYQNQKSILEQDSENVVKLEIPEWDFERLVKEGSVNQIDNSFATMIGSNKSNIVIAGHDIPIVFHDLQRITIGMKVYLKKGNKMIEYIVVRKETVKPTEVQYLEETEEERLTLITCTDYNQKRLIIICKKNNIS